jgi:hypothetical protein
MSPGTEVSSDTRLRVGVLLVILVAVLVFVWFQWPDADGEEVAVTAGSSCPSEKAPALREVSLNRMAELREGISAQAIFGVDLDPYEQGLVDPGMAWTDQEPSMQPLVGSKGRVPAGYEIRWWAPTGHNVTAAVMLFADPSSARSFVALASSTRCRSASTSAAAPLPTGRNLEWRNPYGYVQQDLFLVRGSRVYRLAVVPPGEVEEPNPKLRREGFRLVNGMGAALLGHPRDLPEPGAAI